MTITIDITWRTIVVFVAISWATYVILRFCQYLGELFYLDHKPVIDRMVRRVLWGVNTDRTVYTCYRDDRGCDIT